MPEVSTSNQTPQGNNIEQHPLYRPATSTQDASKFPYGRAHGETCASCALSVPQEVAEKLPEGAPGSLPKDGGRSKYGAPVLRSKLAVCLGKDKKIRHRDEPSSSQESQISSISSVGSADSHRDCHDHMLTYLTSKSPDDPEDYATLRASVIRALSCELLPRGMPEGPICFGDTTTGYTIAYVFRLTDSKARGRRRTYAFVALAGKDGQRAFKAAPILFEAFSTIAKIIEHQAQKTQDDQDLQQQKERDEKLSPGKSSEYSEISSFLTQRPRDPDGQPRRAGQTQPRSLADILDHDTIFVEIHQYFIYVLHVLGAKFGGIPVAEHKSTIHQTDKGEAEVSKPRFPARVSSDILENLDIEDEPDIAATNRDQHVTNSQAAQSNGAVVAKAPLLSTSDTTTGSSNTSTTPTPTPIQPHQTQHISRNSQSQCAPLVVEDVRQQQVKV